MSYEFNESEGRGLSVRSRSRRASEYSGTKSDRLSGSGSRTNSWDEYGEGSRSSRETYAPTGRAPKDGSDLSEQIVRQAINGNGGGNNSRRDASWQKKIKRRKRVRRIIAFIVVECIALTCIFGYAWAAKRWGMMQKLEFEQPNVENADLDIQTKEQMKGYFTFAVFGVDARGKALGKGTNADVNMICNINQDTGEIKLVSVFRDSYLNQGDEKNSYNKINQAYAVGGPEQAVKALNKNLDLNITDYVTFNWKGVADAINILGGVDLEISKAEFYYINSFITETVKVTGIPSKHLKSAGMNHLDGVQAVAYGRLRLMDTDYARTERQRKVIEQAFVKAKKADWSVLNNIVVTVLPQVSTSIDPSEVVWMARSITKYHIKDTTGFPQARGDANMGKKGACVIPMTLESNVKALHTFLFENEEYTPSKIVKSISSKIAADSGIYKEGKAIDRVDTDGGYIPKPTKPPETTASKKKETETDEDGNPIETDSRGNIVETDQYGNRVVRETDSRGNPIVNETTSAANPTSPQRPGGDSGTGETDAAGNPINNPAGGTTAPPRETTAAATTPGGSGGRPTAAPQEPTVEITKPAPTGSPYENSGPGANSPAVSPGETAPTTAVSPGRETTGAVTPGGVPTPTTAQSGTVTIIGSPGNSGNNNSNAPGQ